MSEFNGSGIRMHRSVTWDETDAAGHNHFAAAFRWLEEAEHALMRALGVEPADMGRFPRVHIEIDYKDRLLYGQDIVVEVSVARLGRSSCTYLFVVRSGEGAVAIEGTYVVVHASSTTEGSAPWPDDLRLAMQSGARFEVRSLVEGA